MWRLSGHKRNVTDICFSRDGSVLVSGSADGSAIIRGWPEGQVRHKLAGLQGGVNCVAVSPDGQAVAAAGYDTYVRVWDVASGRMLSCWGPFQGGSFHTAAFSPDGQLLAVGGAYQELAGWFQGVRLWEWQAGRAWPPLAGHASIVACVAFSPDGRTLATGSADFTVHLWDTDTWRVRNVLRLSSHVGALAYGPDGDTLAVAAWRKAVLWHLPTSQATPIEVGQNKSLHALAICPGGRKLLLGGNAGLISVCRVESGRLEQLVDAEVGKIRGLAFSPDGATVVAAGQRCTLCCREATTLGVGVPAAVVRLRR